MFGGGVLLRGMLDGAEDDGDGEEVVLVHDDLCNRGRERAETGAIQKYFFCEVHILVDTPPFTGRRMILDQGVNDIVLAGRTFDDGCPSHQRENPRRAGEPRGGAGFSRSPGSLGYVPFPAKLAL